MSRREDGYFAEIYGALILRCFSDHLSETDVVLDYGCGAGGMEPHLLGRVAEVVGFDPSPRSVEVVTDRFGDHPRFSGAFGLDEMDSQTGRFDAVVVIEVVEHLYDPELFELFENAMRLLKPGGVLLLTTPNQEDLSQHELYCPECGHTYHRWQHVRSWSQSSLAAAVSKVGFDVVSTQATDFRAQWNYDPKRLFKRKVRALFRGKQKNPHLVMVARRPND